MALQRFRMEEGEESQGSIDGRSNGVRRLLKSKESN